MFAQMGPWLVAYFLFGWVPALAPPLPVLALLSLWGVGGGGAGAGHSAVLIWGLSPGNN